MAFQKQREANTVGRYLCRFLRFWFICLLFTTGETGEHGTRGHIWFPIGDEMVRGRQEREAALQHSAVSKTICISGADCEAPAGAV